MKIAMISGWHVHAKGYARQALEIPGVEIKTVWDEDPQRGKKWAEELGCDFVADYDEIMADEEIDGVVIDAPSSMHADLMIRAAKAGKHIFTEKVLTLEVEDAEAVRDAIHENGVRFVISFPHRARRDLLFVKKL
ncbi:MAG: Gfo/Idh/MocA family oxidoreductase, partial [Firmicutes bacterium]|nr:Gfo/Idh/MocA family oxidoreductase [Bacillota bacterium]